MKCTKRLPNRPDLFCEKDEGHPIACIGWVDADGKRYISAYGVACHYHAPGEYDDCDYCSGTPEWRATHQEEIDELNRWVDAAMERDRERNR